MTALAPKATALLERVFPEAAGPRPDPVDWIADRLGERPWSRQQEIARSVVDHRYTAVQSAHGVGKSYIASRLIAWWVSVHPLGSAFAIATAPTGDQIGAIMFRELGAAQRRGGLPGEITGVGAGAKRWTVEGQQVALGRKSQDFIDPDRAAASFQGIHARHELVVLDEASGIQPWLFDAADALATNEGARVLAIGNPTDPQSRFAEVCAPGSGWNVIQVSAFDSPNFTGERVAPDVAAGLTGPTWVEERRARWGERSSQYIARVLGEFPEEAEDTLISRAWVRAAQGRDCTEGARQAASLGEPAVYGVDVARAGSDETMIYRAHGGVVRLEHRARGHDTMRTTGEVARRLRAVPAGSAVAVVDVIGLGAGVYDRLREQGLEARQFQASERARQPERFANRRAEAYWFLREELREGRVDLDPEDEELAAQLLAVRWRTDSRGRTLIESKDEMRRRGVPSPDRADACSMAVVTPGGHGRGPALARSAGEEARALLERMDAARAAKAWETQTCEEWFSDHALPLPLGCSEDF